MRRSVPPLTPLVPKQKPQAYIGHPNRAANDRGPRGAAAAAAAQPLPRPGSLRSILRRLGGSSASLDYPQATGDGGGDAASLRQPLLQGGGDDVEQAAVAAAAGPPASEDLAASLRDYHQRCEERTHAESPLSAIQRGMRVTTSPLMVSVRFACPFTLSACPLCIRRDRAVQLRRDVVLALVFALCTAGEARCGAAPFSLSHSRKPTASSSILPLFLPQVYTGVKCVSFQFARGRPGAITAALLASSVVWAAAENILSVKAVETITIRSGVLRRGALSPLTFDSPYGLVCVARGFI